jgi:short subunit dehydrogenase-like uncharacterized protein
LKTRWILKRLLPKRSPVKDQSRTHSPPSPQSHPADHIACLRDGYFNITNNSHAGSSQVKTVIRADGEPGYFGTARMISEAGLALALDLDKLPYEQVGGMGTLTSMAALGDVYIERLKQYYVESEVISGEERRNRR